MNRLAGVAFSLLVFLAAAFAFSPRPLPQFPPAGVRSDALLLDAARAGERLAAVGERGQILLSDDAGQSWRAAVTPAQATLTALHFTDARHGFAVGHDALILRTLDGGATWQQVHAAPREERPLLDVWFADERRGIAVGAYGAYLETGDGGASWTPRQALPGDRHINAITARPGGGLYLAGESGLLARSRDGGRTWEQLASPYAGSFFGIVAAPDGALIAFGLRGRLFRSTDGGDSWRQVATGTAATLLGGQLLPDGRLVIVGREGTVLASRDQGASFAPLSGSRGPALASVLAGRGGLLLFGEAGVSRLPAGDAP